MSKRAEDLAVLRAIFTQDLSELHQHAFEDMFNWLLDNPTACLSEKQRKWVRDHAEKLDVLLIDPAERNKNVPRGKEVSLAFDQSKLPKKPPGRL